jgi:hypothetical protein
MDRALMQTQHRRSLWLGFALAPWSAPLMFPLLVLGAWLCNGDTGIGSVSNFFRFWTLHFLVGLPFTYIVTAVLVMPMTLWLRKQQALSSIRLCAWCAAVGPLFAASFIALRHGMAGFAGNGSRDLLIVACYGLAVGVAFCAVTGTRLRASKTIQAHTA